ncbi:MAG: 50S ribosomal protein L19 [Patescibacteria group bacterium]
MEKAKIQEEKATFKPGDTLKVFYKVREEGKERIQPFEGTLIAQKGSGNTRTIMVRKLGVAGVYVERIFPLFSPNIEKITVSKKGQVRRAKLYYLRDSK